MGFMDKLRAPRSRCRRRRARSAWGPIAGQMDLANRRKKLMNDGVDTPADDRLDGADRHHRQAGGAEYMIMRDRSRRRRSRLSADDDQYIDPRGAVRGGEEVIVKVTRPTRTWR